jgi:hypothetical protein
MLEAVWLISMVATGASGPADRAEPVHWHVAPDGDDAHPGTAEGSSWHLEGR